jgi:hypothetical protein
METGGGSDSEGVRTTRQESCCGEPKLNLIQETKYPRLIEYSENALSIPGFGGAVLRDRIVTIAEVKRVLKERGKYRRRYGRYG